MQSSANRILFDLFHGGEVSFSGRTIRLSNPVLPVAVRKGDRIDWTFPEPVRVSTPGPDSRISVVRQYRDRIEFDVWPWASVRVEFQE